MPSELGYLAIRDAVAALGFLISLFLLVVHIKNRRTKLRACWIARGDFRSSGIDLTYVGSEQMEGYVLARLVLFNPGAIGVIIKSFYVERKVPSRNGFMRFLGFAVWEPVVGSCWWPSRLRNDKAEKTFEEGYRDLLVNDQRDILVKIPGMKDRQRYRFCIQTNRGGYLCETDIYGEHAKFPHAYREWYKER